MLTTLYRLAAGWTAAGLLAGLAYREITRSTAFTGTSQLGLAHTHLLALGTLMTLALLVLERAFTLSASPRFAAGLWTYSLGVAWTAVMLFVNGVRTVVGQASTPMFAGLSGMGHILITAGLVLLFLALGAAVRRAQSADGVRPVPVLGAE